MSTSSDTTTLAPLIETSDDRAYSREEAANFVLNYLEMHGGTLYVFESTYWGNEAFGSWIEMVIADPVVETDNGGCKVKNATRVGKVIGLLNQYYQARRELDLIRDPDEESNFSSLREEHFEDQIHDAMLQMHNGVGVDFQKSDWFPLSKVRFQTSRRGRDDMVIFNAEEAKARGVADDAECVIEDTTMVRSRYRSYEKLAIEIPYDEDRDPKEYFDWERHHFAAKYSGDDFQCWTADTNPREIACILADHYGTCAVHENLLEQYEG